MSERKLIQAFKTFFQKSVAPFVTQNDDIMREWNHLNKIISSDPIDYSQIEFYLLLSNKNNASSTPQPGSKGNIGSSNKISDNDPNRFRYSDFNAIMDKSNFEKKGSFLNNNNSKKKNLVSSLESFQKLLVYNQERLENLNKKEGGSTGPSSGGVNTSANGISMRRY